MITVLQRPLGFILGDCIEANINEAYAGYATVNKSGHGLVDGDYVYITSNVESYNGFWYVNIEDGNKFKIRQYATADDQAYVVDADIEYCDVDSTHGVSCVHLPITYKLRSDLFPTNEAVTPDDIKSFGNDNGYVNIETTTSLLPIVKPFSFVKIYPDPGFPFFGNADDYEIYQVIEQIGFTSITIAKAYNADDYINYIPKSSLIIPHYNNYNIVVRVYGGLNPSHGWATKKPFELLGTFNLVPDSNNEVFFSISELLKSQIRVNNNLLIDTFPNNIDAFTQFYISYAESYDDSLGTQYALGTFTSSFTDDSFEGMAVNTKLPFKNIHSGSLSNYLSPIKFLTLFTSPLKLNDKYFDLSFINDDTATLYLRKDGVNTAIVNYDEGIYRVQITQPGTYQIHDGSDVISETIVIQSDEECENQSICLSWLNYLGGMDYWNFTSEKEYQVSIEEASKTKTNIFPQWPKSYGEFADTIEKQTFRKSRTQVQVKSQYVTEAQIEAIKYIKTSPLVQIVNSRQDRRTVIVDEDSFTVRQDRQKLFDISFTITYTDEIPSQMV